MGFNNESGSGISNNSASVVSSVCFAPCVPDASFEVEFLSLAADLVDSFITDFVVPPTPCWVVVPTASLLYVAPGIPDLLVLCESFIDFSSDLELIEICDTNASALISEPGFFSFSSIILCTFTSMSCLISSTSFISFYETTSNISHLVANTPTSFLFESLVVSTSFNFYYRLKV